MWQPRKRMHKPGSRGGEACAGGELAWVQALQPFLEIGESSERGRQNEASKPVRFFFFLFLPIAVIHNNI
jgi:hypothetical protein